MGAGEVMWGRGKGQQEIGGENAYLVPHKDLALLRAALARGVKVQLLTNSLASTDMLLVNAAYAKSRPALAELGVALYEMKPHGASRASFNLDPRSMYLDTEA